MADAGGNDDASGDEQPEKMVERPKKKQKTSK
jgi:hypothetical protein